MKIRSWTACMAVVAATSGAGAATASADTITFDTPFAAEMVSSCTGDTIMVQGTTHMKQTNNSTLSGAKSEIEINSYGVTGTTLTGVKYVMNEQYSEIQHADLDDAQVTVEQTINLTRTGETAGLTTGDDLRVHILTHLTVVNGVATADKFDMRDECR